MFLYKTRLPLSLKPACTKYQSNSLVWWIVSLSLGLCSSFLLSPALDATLAFVVVIEMHRTDNVVAASTTSQRGCLEANGAGGRNVSIFPSLLLCFFCCFCFSCSFSSAHKDSLTLRRDISLTYQWCLIRLGDCLGAPSARRDSVFFSLSFLGDIESVLVAVVIVTMVVRLRLRGSERLSPANRCRSGVCCRKGRV